MEEAFFNKDFWRQLVAVLAGAFLGFGLALLTGFILWWWRRLVLARMTRRIIVIEAIYNLTALAQIYTLSQRMRDEHFDALRTSTLRPRAGILQQFMTPESLHALSEGERTALAIVTPQLAHLNDRYNDYERLLSSPFTAIQKLTTETGDVVPHRVWTTDRFLDEVALVGNNLVNFLIEACHEAKGHLAERQSKETASKLAPLTFGDTPNFWRAFKTSLLQSEQDLDPDTSLVVWEHDWPECPMPVIELRPPAD